MGQNRRFRASVTVASGKASGWLWKPIDDGPGLVAVQAGGYIWCGIVSRVIWIEREAPYCEISAERLKYDYWLYAVFNCGGRPELHNVQNPARLGWQPVMAVEHYQVGPDAITSNNQRKE